MFVKDEKMQTPQLLFLFQVKTILKDEGLFNATVTQKSANSQYYTIVISENFFLVDKSGQIKFQVEPCLFYSCFSNDSKHMAILYENDNLLFLILYDVEINKKVWVKQIRRCHKIGINFYQNLILVTSDIFVKIFSKEGEQQFEKWFPQIYLEHFKIMKNIKQFKQLV